MRFLIATLTLAFTVAPLNLSAAAQKTSDVDLLASFVSNRYAYLDVKQTDWPAAVQYYRAKYAAAASDRARFGVLEAMLDELYDARTHLTANYRDSWRLVAYDIWAQPNARGYAVTAVRGESEAQKAGVRAGDALLSIDGSAVSDAIAARRPHFLRSPNTAADEWALLAALSGRHDRVRILGLRDANGATAPAPDLSSSKVNGVPYIAIRSFADERVVDEFDRALAGVRDAPALIIDVRNDNGGDTAVMLPIAGRFLAARRLYAWMARRAGPHLGSRWPEYIDPHGPWRYGGKVIILVDRWSESVAEGFAMALHDARDATVVGTPMAGLGAAVIKKHLPQNDVDAQISAEPVYDATGNPRSDFKPDVLVDLATASGADPILTAGLAAAVPHHAAKL
ncbi:MAG TPA: S41 family peptidase [Candidatus Acidoferrales bacterium]|nr:S41 family peptidase [Candidatus Acidoferrales bacterium]